VHFDAERRKRFGSGKDVSAAAVAADAERQHVWVFDEQQEVADAIRAAVFHELALDRERV
jgi:hypothetical protein